PPGPKARTNGPNDFDPPVGTTMIRSASRSRPARSASASTAAASLAPSTSTTVRPANPAAQASATAAASGAPPPVASGSVGDITGRDGTLDVEPDEQFAGHAV